MSANQPRRKGRAVIRAALLFALIFGAALGVLAILHPGSPLPDGWNPLEPLAVADPVTPLTPWKLKRAVGDPLVCQQVLTAASTAQSLTITETRQAECTVTGPMRLQSVGQSKLSLTETACATALRTAMWERHGVQPAAERHLGQAVAEIIDIGSYNCRRIRTPSGGSNRWSTHATAMAIDVAGFRMTNGKRITLLADWDGDSAESKFLKDVRDAACTWFVTTLSPDYNRLHADHFHLQASGWGLCR